MNIERAERHLGYGLKFLFWYCGFVAGISLSVVAYQLIKAWAG